MSLDNVTLIEEDSTFSRDSRVYTNLLRTKQVTFNAAKKAWNNFLLNRVNAKLEKVKEKAVTTTYAAANLHELTPESKKSIDRRARIIARLEAKKIKLLTRDNVPTSYVNHRAIKLRDKMMNSVVYSCSEAYFSGTIGMDNYSKVFGEENAFTNPTPTVVVPPVEASMASVEQPQINVEEVAASQEGSIAEEVNKAMEVQSNVAPVETPVTPVPTVPEVSPALTIEADSVENPVVEESVPVTESEQAINSQETSLVPSDYFEIPQVSNQVDGTDEKVLSESEIDSVISDFMPPVTEAVNVDVPAEPVAEVPAEEVAPVEAPVEEGIISEPEMDSVVSEFFPPVTEAVNAEAPVEPVAEVPAEEVAPVEAPVEERIISEPEMAAVVSEFFPPVTEAVNAEAPVEPVAEVPVEEVAPVEVPVTEAVNVDVPAEPAAEVSVEEVAPVEEVQPSEARTAYKSYQSGPVIDLSEFRSALEKAVNGMKVKNTSGEEITKPTERIHFDYVPMTAEEIEQSRKNIEYDKYRDIYKNQWREIMDKIEQGNETQSKDVVIREPIVIAPDRELVPVAEKAKTETSKVEDIHFDYSDATVGDVAKAVTVEKSSSGLDALKARAARLRADREKAIKERDAIRKAQEEEAIKASEVADVVKERKKVLDQKIREFEDYCNGLEEDNNSIRSSAAISRNDIECNRRFIQMQTDEMNAIDREIGEIESYISKK